MGKPKRERALPENEAKAVNTIIRVSPQKLNLVAEMIRGKRVERAIAELSFSPKRSAEIVRKTLQSAVANAEFNHGLDVDSLVVSEAHVGQRLVMKRFHPRARGRAGRIEKKFSQLTIVVREIDEDAPVKGKGKGKSSRADAAAGTGE